MSPKIWIATGFVLMAGVVAGWVALGVEAAWPTSVIVLSSVPLGLTLLSMVTLAPKPFFYAALTLTLYIAFAISQIMVTTQSRTWAVVVLATALAYMAVLKFVLQALNARRPQPGPASS